MNSLPQWLGPRGGSGCDNASCTASDRFVRVLSRHEIERVYPRKSRLPSWPMPPKATHMCTSCGFCYSGRAETFDIGVDESSENRPDVRIDHWDWRREDAWDAPSVRAATERFIAGAPADATADEIAEGVAKYVPGVGREFARRVMSEMDIDVTVHGAADYM